MSFFKEIKDNIKSFSKNDIIVIFAVFLLDRITKIWATNYLVSVKSGGIEIFKYFHLTFVANHGAAFGIMQQSNFALLFITLLVLFALVWLKTDVASLGKKANLGYLLIFAGGLGNLYDRVLLGYVVDFLDFKVWPVFNIADTSITIGAIMLGWAYAVSFSKKGRKS
ncbi:MAG: signal peptidase II [Elusimicrobiaceae bacterium]|jgi:signal peptidase II|nr:signal peptidase II [Elusimicrobiaceae bacterium]MBT4008293.1 signal peptidase II [Elusimicrobiaceae bacterium]MBT4403421.1 signal peptidase II [Elusimicrobiaceae bacterium]MBT4439699.1 signal peptidase II [Elusimicrobiaceae bacterium]MBT5987129.1 signal peptidase II [Elusimicrobiaceae bacterium]